MASSGLFGPYPLTQDGVSEHVIGSGPGAYALGRVDDNGTFRISYVGRSDADLNGRLVQHVPKRYTHFKHGFLPSAKEAYLKECRLYHDFNPVDNEVHPAKPQGDSTRCPVCGQ